MNYKNDYIREARQLRSKGSQLSQLHQLYKFLGLSTTALSAGALVSTGAAVVPLTVGLVAYGSSILSEFKKTGKLRLIPWVDEDLSAIAANALRTEGPQQLQSSPHHYLSPEDKALYYLTNHQGHRLTELAQSFDAETFEHIVINLVDHLVVAHQSALNYPELLSQNLGEGAFIRDAIANLPKEAQGQARISPPLWGPKELPYTQPNTVEASVSEVTLAAPRGDYQSLFSQALQHPVISIVGPQGAGKTTLVMYLASLIDGAVVVFDPHARKSDWPGLSVVGRGMRYSAIAEGLDDALELTEARYRQRAELDIDEFSPITYICEELTNWAGQVSGVSKFLKASLSDFRKANQKLIKVAHGETNTAQGGGQGTAKMRGEGEVLIKLTAKGSGTIRFPNSEPIEISFPVLTPTRKNFVTPPKASDELKVTFGNQISEFQEIPENYKSRDSLGSHMAPLGCTTEYTGQFRDLTQNSSKDAFQRALETAHRDSKDLIETSELTLEAIKRSIEYLRDNKRGQIIKLTDLTQNKKNQDFGLGKIDAAEKALLIAEILDLCKFNEQTQTYQVVA